MRQVLNIFVKDVRHLRVEILIALAVVAAQALLGPSQWAVQGPQAEATQTDVMRMASNLLVPITLIAWALLIAQAVHAEPLVGDRQFWITRPYAWKKLLAAKLIFFTLFIYLPFFLLQCVLLAEAGFPPPHWIPRVLLTLLLISASVILPMIAIASVTSNIGRRVLVLVGVLFYWLIIQAVSALQGQMIKPSIYISPVPLREYLIDLLLFSACSLVVVLQYRTRRTLLSRVLLIAALVLCGAIGFVVPDRLLMDRNYPRAGNQSAVPFQVSFAANRADTQLQSWRGAPGDRIGIPLRFTGIAEGSTISVDAVSATFEAHNGARWTSGWQTQADLINFAQGVTVPQMLITIPNWVYSKLKDGPVGVHLTLATTEMMAGRAFEMQLPQPMQEFSVPGVGICKPQVGFSGDAQALACRFPFQAPLTYVSTRRFDQPCSQSQTDPGVEGSGWVGTLNSNAPGPSFFPVVYPAFPLSNRMQQTTNGQQPRNLCPGTPVTFIPYQLVRRMQTTITVQDFHL